MSHPTPEAAVAAVLGQIGDPPGQRYSGPQAIAKRNAMLAARTTRQVAARPMTQQELDRKMALEAAEGRQYFDEKRELYGK